MGGSSDPAGHAGLASQVGDSAALPRRRRAAFPVSPTIGPEGSRACQEMVEAARRLFAERGYHGTSVLAITDATGRSDAAFYQYFQSKLELFRIFFEELGRDLVAHFDSLPTFADGLAGFADFRAWLEGLDAVLRRHSPVFVDWPPSLDSEAAVDNPSEAYIQKLTARLAPRLASADTGGVDPRDLSIAVISLVEWAHVVLQARQGRPDPPAAAGTALHDTLARIIHRSIFPAPGRPGLPRPALPHPALPHPALPHPALPHPALPHPALPRTAPPRAALSSSAGLSLAAWWPAADGSGSLVPGVRQDVTITRRSLRTIDKIAAAAVTALERRGLAGTSVNDVVAEAGVARGTFYLYWTDRAAIFGTLAHWSAAVTRDHFDALLLVDDLEGLERWLDGWLDVVERYGTIFHIWTSEILKSPPLWPLARQLRSYLENVTSLLLDGWGAAELNPPLDHRTGTVALWTLLTEFPYNAWCRHAVLTRDQTLRCQALLLVRGVLGQHVSST